MIRSKKKKMHKPNKKVIVEELMKKHRRTTPFGGLMDLLKMAEKENIKVVWVKAPFNIFDKNSFIGAVKSHKNQIYIIMNENSQLSKTHTLAHLLGHFFMHKNMVETNNIPAETLETFQRSAYILPLEREANEFAYELLMPENIVRERWDKFIKICENKETALKALAESFDKSPLVMSYRLSELNIDWK